MTTNDRLRPELGVPMYRAHMQSMRLLTVDALATQRLCLGDHHVVVRTPHTLSEVHTHK